MGLGVTGTTGKTFGVGVTFSAASRANLIAGWFRPSTLGGNYYIIGLGGTSGVYLTLTTGDIKVAQDRTTDTIYTSGLSAVALEWNFIAVLSSWANTNGTTPHVVYLWNESNPVLKEAACTVSTAGSGNLTGATTTLYLGTRADATTGMVGVIGSGFAITSSAAVSNTLNPLHIAAFGNVLQEARDVCRTRWLEPYIYQGLLPWESDPRLLGSAPGITATTNLRAWDVRSADAYVTGYNHGAASTMERIAMGTTGAPTTEIWVNEPHSYMGMSPLLRGGHIGGHKGRPFLYGAL